MADATWVIAGKPPGTLPEIGKVYEVRHSRKGNFVMRATKVSDEWLTGVILDGVAGAIMEDNVRDEGEEVSVRNTLCYLNEVPRSPRRRPALIPVCRTSNQEHRRAVAAPRAKLGKLVFGRILTCARGDQLVDDRGAIVDQHRIHARPLGKTDDAIVEAVEPQDLVIVARGYIVDPVGAHAATLSRGTAARAIATNSGMGLPLRMWPLSCNQRIAQRARW